MSVLIHLFPSPHTQFITPNTHSTVLLSSWWKTGTAQAASRKCLVEWRKGCFVWGANKWGNIPDTLKEVTSPWLCKLRASQSNKKDHPCHLLLTCLTKWYLYFHKHLMWQRFSERDLLALIIEQGRRLVILQIFLLLSHYTAVLSMLSGAKCY